jgi:hypothetical protein
MEINYIKVITDLETRAMVRRKIRTGEPDRIADLCEAAAGAIRKLLQEKELKIKQVDHG